MIAVGVMAHPARTGMVRQIESTIAVDAVVYDHHGWGENVTGNMAWRLLGQSDAEWCIVLQDDAVVLPDFRERATEALAHAPGEVVSFYVGTGHPVTVQVPLMRALTQADEAGAAWLVSNYLHWGVAVAMRRKDIASYLDWSDTRDDLPYDVRIGRWFNGRNLRVFYTWPSLVDHADTPSLNRPTRKKLRPRRAHRVGAPASGWDTAVVRIPEM